MLKDEYKNICENNEDIQATVYSLEKKKFMV